MKKRVTTETESSSPGPSLAHGPANKALRMHIEYRGEIQPSFSCTDWRSLAALSGGMTSAVK